MLGLIVRRLIAGVITLFVIAVLSFGMTRIAKGSPFSSDRNLHPEIIQRFEEFYGLNKPVHVQFWRALKGYARFDFGPSTMYRGRSANEYIEPGIRYSLQLGALAALFALAVGIPLGIISSAGHNKASDYVASSISTLGICLPNFLLGPLLVLIFGPHVLKWLPTALWPENASFEELKKVILPTITLAMVHIAYISRLGRAGMLDVMHKDYIRTARAKGLNEWSVFMKHGLKNGITPVVSYAGPMIAGVVVGSIVVESVFAIPGLGQHFIKSVTNRDWNILMGCVLVYSTFVIAMNFVVDVMYGLLDPRVRVN